MTCLSTMAYSLMLNGGLTKPFHAKRGISQGDPMSPYLFVLSMEYLGRELQLLTHNGKFNFHPKCRKVDSIHMCFADDLLMYCRADLTSVTLLHEAFQKFSKVSGLHANPTKSSLYIAGVDHTKQDIIDVLGYPEGRVQLIKSVLFGVQTYWAQIFLFPKKALKVIEIYGQAQQLLLAKLWWHGRQCASL